MLTPFNDIAGDDEEDTKLLREMAIKAWEYITSFQWSLPITAAYFADGVGGVVALFLFEFEAMIGGTDDRLWVVVGDLPSAYMVVGPESAKEALEAYCLLMDDWAAAVTETGTFSDVFPVDAARTPGNADTLRRRIEFVRREILPGFSTQSIDTPILSGNRQSPRWPNRAEDAPKRRLSIRRRRS